VVCEPIPGGISKQIRAAGAARVLDQAEPSGAVQAARRELAAGFLADLRRIDAQRRDTHRKLAAAVRASGTTVTGVFGVGPVVAAAVIGDVRDISRFHSKDYFAAYNGTAPVEVSSGNRVICRPSLRGNRRLNHVIHMAAVTQIRYRHSKGRACCDKKLAGGKTAKEALRALKRQVSDATYQHLKADARRAAAAAAGSGGHPAVPAPSTCDAPRRLLPPGLGGDPPAPALLVHDGSRLPVHALPGSPRTRTGRGPHPQRWPRPRQCRNRLPRMLTSRALTRFLQGPRPFAVPLAGTLMPR
jgi:hypothetical protein